MVVQNIESDKEEIENKISLEIVKRIKDVLLKNGLVCDELAVKRNKTDLSIVTYGQIILKIKNQNILLKDLNEKVLCESEIPYKKSKSSPWLKIDYYDILNREELSEIILETYLRVCNVGIEAFGCCSRFNECSDNKQCTHPKPIFARGCYYKKNLEKGRIFYGKNKTI